MGVKERKIREFQRREDEILATAYQLLTEVEPTRMTMEQIAEITEIGRGTIYKHVKSKNEIYAKLIIRRRERFIEKLEQIEQEGVERIPRLVRAYMEYCLEDKTAYSVHKVCNAHCIRDSLSDELNHQLVEQQERKTLLVRKILSKALGSSASESEDLIYYLSVAWGMQKGAIDAFFDSTFEGTILDEQKYFKVVEQMTVGAIPIMFLE